MRALAAVHTVRGDSVWFSVWKGMRPLSDALPEQGHRRCEGL